MQRCKNKNTNEIIQIILNIKNIDFNNLILGEFFDLSIIPCYKGLDYFVNLPENKNCNNEEVLILSLVDEFHYLALKKEETILLFISQNIESYIGFTILITLYKKVESNNIQIGNVYYNWMEENFEFNLSDSITNGYCKDITINNEQYILNNFSIVNTNNIGKTLTVNYIPLKYASLNSFKESNNKEGYELLSIIRIPKHFNNFSVQYIFRDVSNPSIIFGCLFYKYINLDNKLGSIFTFTYNEYYRLSAINNVNRNKTKDFLLSEIIPNSSIKIFVKDNLKYAINTDYIAISDNLLGVYFDIDIKPYIFGVITDVY